MFAKAQFKAKREHIHAMEDMLSASIMYEVLFRTSFRDKCLLRAILRV